MENALFSEKEYEELHECFLNKEDWFVIGQMLFERIKRDKTLSQRFYHKKRKILIINNIIESLSKYNYRIITIDDTKGFLDIFYDSYTLNHKKPSW